MSIIRTVLLTFVVFTAACAQPQKTQSVSLQQAREFALELEASELETPPRSISGLKIPDNLDIEDQDAVSCSSNLDKTIEEIQKRAKYISQNMTSDYDPTALRKAAGEAFSRSSLEEAIILAQAYRKRAVAISHKGEANAKLAIYNANRGDLQAARKYAFRSKGLLNFRHNSSGINCDYRNTYYRNRVQAHMAYFEEDYETVDFRARAALIALHLQHRTEGVCRGHRQGWRIPELQALRARALAARGSLTEAEAAIRPYKFGDRQRILNTTSAIYLDQGRTDDALLVAHAALAGSSIVRSCSAFARAESREAKARALMVNGQWPQARQQYELMSSELILDPQTWQGRFASSTDYGIALLHTGDAQTALTVFDTVEARRTDYFSADSREAVEARALRGLALAAMGRNDEALATFRTELPMVIADWHDAVSNKILNATPLWRLRLMAAAYIGLLLETGDPAASAEAFSIADAVNGRGVQRTFQASIARVLERENADQGLIRSLQNTEQAIKNLNQQLVVNASQNADNVADLREKLQTARASLNTLNDEVEARYPAYKSLVNPDPIQLQDIQDILSADEALLLTFVAEKTSYVWAVPKIGKPRGAVIPLGKAALEEKVTHLRSALAPTGVSAIGDIPDFDVKAAHELYKALLATVEDGWGDASHLILVADGPLGSLPFGLLVNEDRELPNDGGLYFDGYREVPWLINRVSLSRVPSVSSLVALRKHLRKQLAGDRSFVGFGDPVFRGDKDSEREMSDADSLENSQRGVALRAGPGTRLASSADLSNLQRLPETADEILAIAKVLGANPDTDVFLRENATELQLKELSRTGILSEYRVISFATHGLVPGDLDGLRRPSLALSRPVEGDTEDGLLTTDDIIGLKLNADWVVLSACNTGADSGNGSDAVSGLGQAFFHAGTRALLVSNWPVHSDATRDLMVTLFRHQSEKGGPKAASLRYATGELIRKGVFKDQAGKEIFAYAHPLFWAPFTLIGDGA